MSSNPFRRKTPSTTTTTTHISSRCANIPLENASREQSALPKKITKKVRVQSPPPPSPSTASIPDSSSTVGGDSYATAGRPHTPPVLRADDPFDGVTSDTSEDEEVRRLDRAPANPFAKTLDTMEHPERGVPGSTPTNTTTARRASMDVEAFKRLLMTGNAGLSTPAAHPHVAHTLGDGGSSTDASSSSRQSIFEAVQEPLPESPRTSHEISEPEDDLRGLLPESSAAARKKPPPPSSRHGKLIKVELRDESASNALQAPPTPGSITSQHYFISSGRRSQTDLNKPLPPAPARASHESERESVFDKEAAGKTPEPPSPSSPIRKKNPPVPPLARRHSHKVAEPKLSRSDSTRLSLMPRDELPRIALKENSRPSTENVRIPPPPPSRRLGSVRGSSHARLSSPSTISLPAPPPTRGLSRSVSGGNPPSLSVGASTTNKRASIAAPPPPPPRHGRNGMEFQSPGNSRRPSGECSRRSDESGRRSPQPEHPADQHDVLADLSKLQREIDALRQSETERIR